MMVVIILLAHHANTNGAIVVVARLKIVVTSMKISTILVLPLALTTVPFVSNNDFFIFYEKVNKKMAMKTTNF
jgi:hypothetical protein